MIHQERGTQRRTMALLFGCLALSLFCVIYPVFVIWPFRAQRPGELAAALMVLRFGPAATVISGAAAIVAVIFYWRTQPKRWRRVLPVAATVFTCALAWLARVNIYELMFHPDARPTFRAAAQVKLDNNEKVIAVKIGDAARAYPIRNVSYHHVINDVLNKVAIVATY
jgi:hypothetical protein